MEEEFNYEMRFAGLRKIDPSFNKSFKSLNVVCTKFALSQIYPNTLALRQFGETKQSSSDSFGFRSSCMINSGFRQTDMIDLNTIKLFNAQVSGFSPDLILQQKVIFDTSRIE